ncbi:indolethylamine N-methyltransferase [Xenopus laevis]|uniref:Indolethylamine N-methyltransferase n=2 Tax=Xenopus laevis TaxID=8355 RepID=A0A1L8FLW2_XENLA|nr:indolethylamine N-methyltransferase [Xenopus laevis]OCT72541.1 hypothetical protein XELAEV_18035520mg [Xenopus laevis]
MDTKLTGKDIYEEKFNPQTYLETFYKPNSGVIITEGCLEFILRKLHETFTERGVKGETLIDIGQGPTIYQDLSACESFKEIIGAEYTDCNREYYEKTLRNEPGIFDWTTAIQAVCDLEGKGTTVEEKREKLKKTVTKIIKCDINKSNPVEPLVLPRVDCVMTIWCLECASDLDSFCNALKNISSLLKVGGHLIIAEILNCTYFLLGGTRFSCVTLTEEFMRNAITDAGFSIIDLEVLVRKPDKMHYNLSDHDSIIFLLARKLRDI